MQTPTAPAPQRRSAVYWALSDNWELSKRSVRHIKRDPDQLASVTIQPIILVVLFRYFIGGAIRTGSSDTYINFLMAGIFIETAALTATTTGTSVAADMLGGSIDRFRSLPVMKSAVLTGYIVADLLRASLGLVVLVALGLAVGFRPRAGVGGWLAAVGVTLLVTIALCWVSAVIGLLGRSVEAVQQFTLILIIPILASSAFVPTQTMPGWLRAFADHQPMTQAVDAVRALLLAQPVGGHAWSALAWFTGILVLAFGLAALLFARRASR